MMEIKLPDVTIELGDMTRLENLVERLESVAEIFKKVDAQAAEIERLRAALEEIIDCEPDEDWVYNGYDEYMVYDTDGYTEKIKDIARAALEKREAANE